MNSIIKVFLFCTLCLIPTAYGEILSPIKINFFVKTLDAEKITVMHNGKTAQIPKKLVSSSQLKNLKIGEHQTLEFSKEDFEKVKTIISSKLK